MKHAAVTALACMFTVYAFPLITEAAGLMDVYASARQNDAQIQAALANYDASQQAHPIARAALLPQVAVTAETSDNRQEIDGQTFGIPGRKVNFNTNGYSVSLSQALYHYDFYIQLRQAKNSVAQARIQLDQAQQELIIRVTEAYFNVLAAMDGQQFAQSEKMAIARQLEQAEKRFEVGLIPITDVKEAQSSYDRAVASEIESQTAVTLAQDALSTITGLPAEPLRTVSDRVQLLTPEPNDADEWVLTAMEQNLALLIAEYDTEIAQQEIELQRAQHLPTLDIVASHSDYDTGGISGPYESEDSKIGIELNIPIFEGGRAYYRTKEARHQHRASLHEQEQIRRETRQLTRDAFFKLVAGVSRVNAFARSVESAEVAAESSEAGFQVGTRTSVDVLIALRNVYEAKRDYARSRYDYLLDSLRLKQAAGILQSEDLQQIETWLE